MLPLPQGKVYLRFNGDYITGKELPLLQRELAEYELQEYIKKRHEWSDRTIESIAWDAYSRVVSTSTTQRRSFIVKLGHGWLPVGVRTRRYDGNSPSECPACRSTETVDHLFQCPGRRVWKEKFVSRLGKYLRSIDTKRSICSEIVEGIQNWLDDIDDVNSSQEHSAHNDEDTSAQDDIGWGNALRGYLASEWQHQQEEYYRAHGQEGEKVNTGEQWMTHVIRFLITEAHTLWTDRCNELHEKDEQHRSKFHTKRLTQTVTVL